MKNNKRIFIKAILIISMALIILYAVFICISSYVFADLRVGKDLLISGINHEALLHDCRKIMREKHNGKWQNTYYRIKMHMLTGNEYDPEIDDLPVRILVLNPTYVRIYEDHVDIEMTGRFGLTAYAENYNSSRDDKKLGDRKLIEGLWYYR